MTNFSTISLDDLAFVTGGATTEAEGTLGPVSAKYKHESDPAPAPDPIPYMRCVKQTYDQSPLYDQWFRPNREARLAERMCSQYREK
jgi:hypothetical protein